MSKPPVKKLRAHVFICTNHREPGHPRGCCQEKGSEKLLELFKEELRKSGIKDIRAQRAGCLDTCEHGPSVVVYPENVWYGAVKPEDISEIVRAHLIEGTPVSRLRIPGK